MGSFKWHELGPTYEEIAEAFWRLSGLPKSFPRDIFTACIWTLPVGVMWISGLTGSAVAAHLPSSRCAEQLGQYAFSPLYGCLVASKGAGIIFLEKDLPQSEASFTIAHEVSHFLMDYLIPRERALSKLGDRIRPVLDGERVPDVEERVDALLCGIPLGTYVNATPRERRLCSEDRADMLALELLAPAKHVLEQVLDETDSSHASHGTWGGAAGSLCVHGCAAAEERMFAGNEFHEVPEGDGLFLEYVVSQERLSHDRKQAGETTVSGRTTHDVRDGRGGMCYLPNGKTVPAMVSVRAADSDIAGILMTRYGLPASAARWYADYLKTRLAQGGSRGSFREWLEGPGSVKERDI